MRSRHEHYSTDLMDRIGDNWRRQAACRDHDPELFFPEGTGPTPTAQTEQATEVCHGCPVVDECLTWALDVGVTDGIIGGTTPAERRRIREGKPQRPPGRPPSQHLDRVLELAQQGYYDREIADDTGIEVNTIKSMRQRRGIPSGRSRRRELHRAVMGR